MKKETDINIDALLRDTFLTVVELRQGTTVVWSCIATASGRGRGSANA